MSAPTPDYLLERTLAQASGGRNDAGYWLARQLSLGQRGIPSKSAGATGLRVFGGPWG